MLDEKKLTFDTIDALKVYNLNKFAFQRIVNKFVNKKMGTKLKVDANSETCLFQYKGLKVSICGQKMYFSAKINTELKNSLHNRWYLLFE